MSYSLSSLGAVRIPIQRSEGGLLRSIAGATVGVYDTLITGYSPVKENGDLASNAVLSKIYEDKNGLSLSSNPLVSDDQGVIEFFAPLGNYHLQITTVDGQVFGMPWVGHYGEVYDLRHLLGTTEDLQTAINSEGTRGGKIELAPGDHVPPTTIEMRRGVTLKGYSWAGWGEAAAAGPWDSPSKIKNLDPDTNVIEMIDAPFCHLEDLQIVGGGVAGSQMGILALFEGNPIVAGFTAKRVLVQDCGLHGIYTKNCYLSEFEKVFCVNNQGCGMFVDDPSGEITNPHYLFDNCWFLGNGDHGFFGTRMGPAIFRGCSFQANKGIVAVQIANSTGFEFQMCNFEQLETLTAPIIGLSLEYCSNFKVSGLFSRSTAGAGRAVRLYGCHHGRIDQVFSDNLQTSIILLTDDGAGNITKEIEISGINDPDGDAALMVEGTWGTGYKDCRASGFEPTVSVASAAALTLPDKYARFIAVTGTTNITSMTASWRGRVVTLQFSGILNFTNGNNLKLVSTFATTANDTITLICDGTNWIETSRSVI